MPGTLLIVGAFDGRGGKQRQAGALAAALAERADVTVITWTTSPRPSVERRGGRITILRVPALAPWSRTHRPLVAWANAAVRALTGIVAAFARRRSYTSILAIGLNPEGVVAAVAGWTLRRPVVLYSSIAGQFDSSTARLRASPFAPLWRRVLAGAVAYVAQTDADAGELARLGFRRDRIHVIPVGVDIEAFAPPDSEARRAAKARLGVGSASVALYHGRFDLVHKRLDLLLEAWDSAALGGWRLVLAGGGPDAFRVRELAKHVHPPVVFVEWQEDVRWLLSAADLALLPSSFEGTSGAMAEAMAFGLPVLASQVPAQDRIRPDGVVLVPNERNEWTAALVTLARDADRRAELGGLARAWVETHYDARARAAAFAALLHV